RTEKAINKDGADKHNQKLLYTEVYTQEAFNRIEADAKEILIAVEEGDNLRMMLSSLRKLTRHDPINVIGKKREIAAKVIAEEKYVLYFWLIKQPLLTRGCFLYIIFCIVILIVNLLYFELTNFILEDVR